MAKLTLSLRSVITASPLVRRRLNAYGQPALIRHNTFVLLDSASQATWDMLADAPDGVSIKQISIDLAKAFDITLEASLAQVLAVVSLFVKYQFIELSIE